MSGCIHRVGDTFSVADADGMWLPGIYADEDACRKALEVAEVNYGGLVELARWETRGQGDDYRPITVEDLAALEVTS